MKVYFLTNVTDQSPSWFYYLHTDGSDTDLAKEKAILDEKLKMLDNEIAQQVSSLEPPSME